MKGTVKWYNHMRGYGFIVCEDGTDVFVHRSALQMEIALYEGDQVEYEIEDSERGLKAINVKKLKKAA
jgi:CspA family cold shock protein